MRKLNITEIWQRTGNSGGNSYHIQPQEWDLGTLNKDDDDDDDDEISSKQCSHYKKACDNNSKLAFLKTF